jgi:glycosyltransferase involved in cell wall biosynthesis
MPLVSVVVPFYDRKVWLEEAADSVLSQTFGDFELILVDDGSTEDISTLKALTDRRVSLIRQENKGRSAARNAGARMARGKYVAFLDSDDLFLPTKLEKQVALMESDPNVLLSHTSYLRIDSCGKTLGEVESGTFGGNVYPRILVECPIATPTVMVRAKLFETFSFEEKIHVGEDIVLWARISQKTSVIGIRQPLSLVRVHRNSAVYDHHSQIAGFRNVMKYVARHDKRLPLFFRSKQVSRVYVFVAWRLLEEERRWESIMCLIKGVFGWPLIVLRFSNKWGAPPDFATTLVAAIAPRKYRTRTVRLVKKDWKAVCHKILAFCRLYTFILCFPIYLLFTNPAEFMRRAKKKITRLR